MTNSGFEYVEPIFRRVRHVSNYGHNTINSADISVPEMPIPEFKDYDGFWNTSETNDKYWTGFIDFNYKACTGDTTSWKFEYLLGQSEFKADSVGGTNGKPVEFSRDNWSMHDCDINSSKVGGISHNFEHLWRTRGGDNPGPAVCIDRSSNNYDKRFSWGYLDCQWSWGNPVRLNVGTSRQAHYIRAKGITFRYEIGFNENTQSFGNEDKHGVTPLRSMGLIFMKSRGANSSNQDDKAYYAELLMEKNAFATTYSQAATTGYVDISQRNTERQFHNVDWGTDWNILYNEKIIDPETGEENVKLQSTMGGGPWDEFGYFAHKNHYASYTHTRANQPPEKQTGYATLMLSKAAVEHIWANDMVCVGMVCTSAHGTRNTSLVGSTCHFKIWDVKLLEMEHSSDNELVLPPKESLESQYFSNVMREAGRPGYEINTFCKISRHSTPYGSYEPSLDIN